MYRLKIWYSVRNLGDGSALPTFFESEELAKIDQEYLEEGWGEDCTGYVIVESESPITVIDVTTKEQYIKEILSRMKWNKSKYLQEKLNKVMEL